MTDPARPGGTVYGRGGVDVSDGVPARLPRTLIAAVSAGVVAVLGVGYLAWNTTGGSADKPAAAAATAPTSPVVTAPAASAVSTAPAPAQLAAGSWLLSPAGEPETHLSVRDDVATMSPIDPATLTAVAGLADDTCFSFRTGDDRYLRHFDYRLRFDASEDSDLFRADATFCPGPGADAGTFRLRSKNYPEHLVHRRDDDSLYIDKPSGDDAESTFAVQPGT
ncbi:AbfB domain-containing protein [Actinoplanes sp. DH11]|uniref:AbfB domain-containing protein n=1 Tax=Actinoplanes sp. DH11 TaxID=2857011 RepID=UPI001E370B56|nr:AbfB domain-containing protein [Actinoplanes sp. DH11]